MDRSNVSLSRVRAGFSVEDSNDTHPREPRTPFLHPLRVCENPRVESSMASVVRCAGEGLCLVGGEPPELSRVLGDALGLARPLQRDRRRNGFFEIRARILARCVSISFSLSFETLVVVVVVVVASFASSEGAHSSYAGSRVGTVGVLEEVSEAAGVDVVGERKEERFAELEVRRELSDELETRVQEEQKHGRPLLRGSLFSWKRGDTYQ